MLSYMTTTLAVHRDTAASLFGFGLNLLLPAPRQRSIVLLFARSGLRPKSTYDSQLTKDVAMNIVAEEHWVQKGPVKLSVYRKHDVDRSEKPVLFMVHGSTFSSRGTYDVMVDGNTDYSAMEHFARLGYDVWTMDHEGYGFSDRTDSNSGIMVGVGDLQAAVPLVLEKSRQAWVFLYGESSGAIKAGAYTNLEPSRVARLMMHAHTHHGKNAPEMQRRRSIIEQLKATPRRPFGKAQIDNVFNRDKSGQVDPAIISGWRSSR